VRLSRATAVGHNSRWRRKDNGCSRLVQVLHEASGQSNEMVSICNSCALYVRDCVLGCANVCLCQPTFDCPNYGLSLNLLESSSLSSLQTNDQQCNTLPIQISIICRRHHSTSAQQANIERSSSLTHSLSLSISSLFTLILLVSFAPLRLSNKCIGLENFPLPLG